MVELLYCQTSEGAELRLKTPPAVWVFVLFPFISSDIVTQTAESL